MKWTTRSYVDQKWAVKDYRGNTLRGEVTGTNESQTYFTSGQENSEVKAYCESLRKQSPTNLIDSSTRPKIVFKNNADDTVHILKVGYYGYASIVKSLNPGDEYSEDTSE